MRYNKAVLIMLATTFFCGVVMADQRWTRKEATYIVQTIVASEPQDGADINSLIGMNDECPIIVPSFFDTTLNETPVVNYQAEPISRGETIDEVVQKIKHPKMTKQETWYFKEELKFLNKNKIAGDSFKPGVSIEIAKYQPFNGGKCCSDMRNFMVAVMKGHGSNFPDGKGVHWAYMIGVRTQENPSKSRDHYAYGVVVKKGTNLWTQAEWGAKILKRVTRNAHNPSFSDVQRASKIYTGHHTTIWPRNVWAVMKRCQGK